MSRRRGWGKSTVLCTWTSCTPNPASMARAALRQVLGQMGFPGELISDLVLAVSEAVANASVHAVGPYELRLRCTAAEIICEVHDGDPRIPQIPDFRAAPEFVPQDAHRGGGLDALCAVLSERGRGLCLVHELTNGAWGFRSGKRSKVLWLAWPLPHLATVPSRPISRNVTDQSCNQKKLRLMETSSLPGQPPEELSKAATKSAEELRAALASHGIKLPLLRLDPMTNTAGFPCPLISLGSCTLDTAGKLTAVLRTGQPADTGG